MGLLQYIPPDPTAFFTVEDSVCAPATITLANNSTFGCANSLDPSYNPNGQPYSLIQPSFTTILETVKIPYIPLLKANIKTVAIL